jgi:signal peptidase I
MSRTNILSAKSNKKNIFLIVILVAFFTVANSFAQKLSIDSASVIVTLHENDFIVDETPAKATATSVSSSNVNFILWFMGTKEDVNSTISSEAYSKKSFLTSGREPNHLLLKTLLKKAINIKSC